jgi:hypothetical protein
MVNALTAGVGSATPFGTAQTSRVRSPNGSGAVLRGLGLPGAVQSLALAQVSTRHMIVAFGASEEKANLIELSELIWNQSMKVSGGGGTLSGASKRSLKSPAAAV